MSAKKFDGRGFRNLVHGLFWSMVSILSWRFGYYQVSGMSMAVALAYFYLAYLSKG